VHAGGDCLLVCARHQRKLLPAGVVREVVEEKANEIEQEEGRKLGRNERRGMRDQVIQELMPKAFTTSRDIYAYVDVAQGWLLVDTATRSKAEDLSVLLRDCLDTLPIASPQVAQAPAAVMTDWLARSDPPPAFTLGDQCELRDPGEDGGVVRCARQDLQSDEIQAHLAAGKQAARLALDWDDRLSLMLADDLQLRRLRFGEAVLDSAAEGDSETREQQFEAEFAIMSQELRRFLPELMSAFGGEVEQQAPV